MILKKLWLFLIITSLNIISIQNYCIPVRNSNCLFQESLIEFGAPYLITTTLYFDHHETTSNIDTSDASLFSTSTELASIITTLTLTTTSTIPTTTTIIITTTSMTTTTITTTTMTSTVLLTTTTPIKNKSVPSNYVRRGQYRVLLSNGTYLVYHVILTDSNFQDSLNQSPVAFNFTLSSLKSMNIYSGTYVSAIELFYLNGDVEVYGNVENPDISLVTPIDIESQEITAFNIRAYPIIGSIQFQLHSKLTNAYTWTSELGGDIGNQFSVDNNSLSGKNMKVTSLSGVYEGNYLVNFKIYFSYFKCNNVKK
jgi:hypothetical protein